MGGWMLMLSEMRREEGGCLGGRLLVGLEFG